MSSPRRLIEVNQNVIAPREPRLKTVRPRRLAEYSRVPAAHRDVARLLSSPMRMGPPICDELIALVEHLFTEEEAAVVRHLGLLSGKTLRDIARAEHKPDDIVEPILDRLANEKRAILRSGSDDDARYRLLPIVPGIFEMTLVSHTPDSLTEWHRRFIVLFEALFDTGFSLDYQDRPTPSVRYLPVGKAIEGHPMALPTDKLEVVLDQYDAFAVGQCQCRMAMQVVGKGCGKPLGNCMVMGQWAERCAADGSFRTVSRREALEIKREAGSHGLVNWMMNVASERGQCSCSCCGCCCHAMRIVNEFNAPGVIAPPHFLPQFDASRCNYCGKCATRCPMGAIVIDRRDGGRRGFLRERCIGCGLCVLACERQHALVMEPVPDYRLPYRSWFSFIAHALPGAVRTSWRLWRERR